MSKSLAPVVVALLGNMVVVNRSAGRPAKQKPAGMKTAEKLLTAKRDDAEKRRR